MTIGLPASIDRHTLAAISLAGSSLDVLGALYLAYDLFGGEHGPLRTLTRGVTYGAIYGIGYGLFLGPVFGALAGAAHGITLAWELSRAARGLPQQGVWVDLIASGIRGLGFGLGSAHLFGATFGATFGGLSAAGQAIIYQFGIRPTVDYKPAKRPRVSKIQVLAALNRTVGYAVAGYVSSLVAGQREHAVAVGLTMGLAIGVVTGVTGIFTPLVEWGADHMPGRGMGVFGVALILAGFGLQSTQYWAALLDIAVR